MQNSELREEIRQVVQEILVPHWGRLLVESLGLVGVSIPSPDSLIIKVINVSPPTILEGMESNHFEFSGGRVVLLVESPCFPSIVARLDTQVVVNGGKGRWELRKFSYDVVDILSLSTLGSLWDAGLTLWCGGGSNGVEFCDGGVRVLEGREGLVGGIVSSVFLHPQFGWLGIRLKGLVEAVKDALERMFPDVLGGEDGGVKFGGVRLGGGWNIYQAGDILSVFHCTLGLGVNSLVVEGRGGDAVVWGDILLHIELPYSERWVTPQELRVCSAYLLRLVGAGWGTPKLLPVLPAAAGGETSPTPFHLLTISPSELQNWEHALPRIAERIKDPIASPLVPLVKSISHTLQSFLFPFILG